MMSDVLHTEYFSTRAITGEKLTRQTVLCERKKKKKTF